MRYSIIFLPKFLHHFSREKQFFFCSIRIFWEQNQQSLLITFNIFEFKCRNSRYYLKNYWNRRSASKNGRPRQSFQTKWAIMYKRTIVKIYWAIMTSSVYVLMCWIRGRRACQLRACCLCNRSKDRITWPCNSSRSSRTNSCNSRIRAPIGNNSLSVASIHNNGGHQCLIRTFSNSHNRHRTPHSRSQWILWCSNQ